MRSVIKMFYFVFLLETSLRSKWAVPIPIDLIRLLACYYSTPDNAFTEESTVVSYVGRWRALSKGETQYLDSRRSVFCGENILLLSTQTKENKQTWRPAALVLW